ncbi:uncharacterized protein BJX67DRAFT_192588 [Aspergillus lucknowensis]|uniref:Uncharacterized protein n=1 Tax=Aspergillus lucknowensis TaxID=176173 RepID=A0ABR4LKN4_9EURO
MMFKSTLPLLLSTTLLASVSAQSTGANCTVFNWDRNPAYIAQYPPQRISAGATCPENNQNLTCPLTASGDAQYSATTNITRLSTFNFAPVVEETVAGADNSESDNIPTPFFNETIIASIDATRILEPGQSAYLNFTAYRFCYTGTVGKCTEGVEDGVGVEICAPFWHNTSSDGFPSLDGEYKIVNISEEDVGRYPDPYENQVRGEDDGEGGAAGLRVGGGVVFGGMVTALMMLI